MEVMLMPGAISFFTKNRITITTLEILFDLSNFSKKQLFNSSTNSWARGTNEQEMASRLYSVRLYSTAEAPILKFWNAVFWLVGFGGTIWIENFAYFGQKSQIFL